MARPDFSGEWTFVPGRSSLQIPAPDSTTFAIEHREPRFRLTRTHTFQGKSDTFTIELTTGGEPVVLHHGPARIEARLVWDGDALKFDSTIEKDGERGSNIVRYTLADGGRTFIGEERFRSPSLNYDNVWVFEKGI